MNNAGNTQVHGLTTEQIAAAGRSPVQESNPAPAWSCRLRW